MKGAFLFLQQFELCEVRVLFTRVVNGQHGVCLCDGGDDVPGTLVGVMWSSNACVGSVLFCILFGVDPVLVLAPVWLHQGGVDVGGGDCGALCAHGLYEAGGGEVNGMS